MSQKDGHGSVNGQMFIPLNSMGQPQQTAYPFLVPQPTYYQAAQPQLVLNADIQPPRTIENSPLLQKQGNCCSENVTPDGNDGGCKIKSACRWSRCCRYVSNLPLGNNTEFLATLIFSNLVPVASALIVFALESSQLARIGTLYGNGNFFLTLAIALIYKGNHHLAYVGAAFSLIAAIIFYVAGCKRWCGFLYAYQEYIEKNPAEKAAVVSEVGGKRDYWISFFVSLIIPLLGTLIRLWLNKTLQSRFGCLKGLAWHMIVFGVLSLQADGGARVLLGLLLLQFAAIHFRKAFVCATGGILMC